MRRRLNLTDAIIAWSPLDAQGEFKKTAGQVRVGPPVEANEADWTTQYENTAGAAYVFVRRLRGADAKLYVLREFFNLVILHGLDPETVAGALSHIEEFVAAVDEAQPRHERKTVRPSRTS
jgi:hypothetical protein